MNKFSIDGLLALNLEEIKIVFLRCRGESVEETAEYLNIGVSTIYSRMSGIYKLLGLSSWKEVEGELCVTLRRIVPDVRALEEGWPEAFREKIGALRASEPVEEPAKPSLSSSPPPSTANPEQSQSNPERNQRSAPRTRVPWPLIAIPLLIVALLCIAGAAFGRTLLGNFLRPAATASQPAETSVPVTPEIQDTSTAEPSPVVQPSDTQAPLATETVLPTPTFTSTVTITPVPSETKSPLDLRVGDVLEDARVSLRLLKVGYNEGYDRIGGRRAPISYYFDFTNHSGETIVLQFDQYDFLNEDDTGGTANCWFYHISGAGPAVNEPLANGATRQIVARCGDGNLNPAVNTFTLTVHQFSSLPESKWIVEIPH